jgi:hypothetical protein
MRSVNLLSLCALFCRLERGRFRSLEEGAGEGDCPVRIGSRIQQQRTTESRFLEVKRKKGGNLHPRQNIVTRSIAYKYREGKMKSTPKGELKDLKLAKMK